MRLIKLQVRGQLGCLYEFDKVNVILGDNNSGKSTFIKLILFCLGAPIKSFIDEISKQGLCDNVSLDVEFKNGKGARILRNLPASDAIVVTPIKNSGDLVNEEIAAFSEDEFSDYLLENEGYAQDKIVYSTDKTATFRFYFLLRAIYVDQDTAAQSILSDLDMGAGYFTSQPTIKKSIIEKLLGKDNSELQRIRLELQNLGKIQGGLTDRISFLEHELAELGKDTDCDITKINEMLAEIAAEKKALTNQEFRRLASIKSINDLQRSKTQITQQSQLRKCYERQQTLTLELQDVEEVIKSLIDDLALLKYKAVAKDILEDLPILYCPNCLSPLSEELVKKGFCENCHKKTVEERVINSAALKKTIQDSISEAKEIQQLKYNMLAEVRKEISSLNEQLSAENEKALQQLQQENNLIYEAISEIKERLEFLLEREHVLKRYKATLKELTALKDQRKENNLQLAELREQLGRADTQASLSMQCFNSFQKNFFRYLGTMFSEIGACEFDENYMPIIDNTKMNSVASASLKVAIRLAYVLALLNAPIGSNALTTHLGILLLDSPKDKELDDYRFDKYLQLIGSECCGQVIITGTLSDEQLYKDNLPKAHFFEPLRTTAKLLQRTDRQ